MTQQDINSPSMLRIGTTLRGIYRIDSYLSSGGFGNTYVATNIEFEERVAIKEFFMKGVTQRDGNQTTVSVSNAENVTQFEQQREKFKKEARRLRQLNNPYIVRVHDLFEENGTAYYVMDYVDGENLSDRLKRTGRPMKEAEVNDILPQILDALKSVHDAGIWHLDLKPANIMVNKNGQVRLIDFGASKQLNAQKGGATTRTAISYTNGYAPREQMEQNYDKFGPWTDIYALGATLYNLLTANRPPLPTDIDDDMSDDKHLALPMPNVSGDMKRRVLWMMNTNRLQRPQRVGEIAEKVVTLLPKIEYPKGNPSANDIFDNEETIIAAHQRVGVSLEKVKAKLQQIKIPEPTTNMAATDVPTCDEETIIANPQQKNNKVNMTDSNTSLNADSNVESHSVESNNDNSSIEEDKESTTSVITIFLVIVVMFAMIMAYYQQNNGYGSKDVWLEWGAGTYEGNLTGGMPDGHGQVKFDNGTMYIGDFKNGNITGHGLFKYSNGKTKYEGGYLNAKRHGQGIVYFANGDIEFKGTFENGNKKDGYGKESGKNNDGETWEYEGEYKNGTWNGKGTLKWSNGEKYEGDWKNGERTGNGIYTWNEKRKGYGYKYKGGFLNNKFHGKGTWYYVGGETEKCRYKNGKQI